MPAVGGRFEALLPRAIGGVVILLCALLVGMLWFVHRSVEGASAAIVQAQGIQLVEAVHRTMRSLGGPPQAADLAALVADEAHDGLRFVALLHPEGEGVLLQAGTPVVPLDAAALRALSVSEPVAIGGRMRLLAGPPPGRPPLLSQGREPHEPPAGGFGAAPFAPPPLPGELSPSGDAPPPGAPPALGFGALPPPLFPHRGPPPLRILVEFEPLLAERLAALAERMLWIGVVALVPFLAAGFVLTALVRQRDELTRRLAHGQKLAALGEMSAVIAHELRNPLASLKGHAQLLHRSLADDERSAKADLVVREAVRLQTLLTDLLEFAKAESLVPKLADPKEILRESADAVDAARIAIDAARAPDAWRLDPGPVRQALVNLLRNALQASPDGLPVQLTAFCEDDRLVFEVRDRGPGIAPGDEERIFEPFVTGKVRGTGLGLSLVRRTARQHGGAATACNATDGGAIFRLSLARI